MHLSLTLAALVLITPFQSIQAQENPVSIPEGDARKNLLPHPDPIYPAIAKAAQIEGDIKIAVTINSAGNIASEKVLSGNAMLQSSALEAVKKWQFKPFLLNGSATPVSTMLVIPFHLQHDPNGPTPEQEAAAQAWFPLSDKCRASLKARNTQGSIQDCKAALDMSLKAGDLTSSDQLARLDSLQRYGHALLNAGQPDEALNQETQATQVARTHLKDNQEEYASPFAWKAIVEVALGNAAEADADFTIAEQTMRKAILDLPDMKGNYSRYLAVYLRQHGALLDQIGRSSEASKLRAEADSLQ
jgi:TonB family protein